MLITIIDNPSEEIFIVDDNTETKYSNITAGDTITYNKTPSTETITIIANYSEFQPVVVREYTVQTTVESEFSELTGSNNSIVESNPSTVNTNATHRVYGNISNGDTTGSSLTSFHINYGNSSNPQINTTQSDISKIGIDRNNDGSIDQTVNDDISSVSVTDGMLKIKFGVVIQFTKEIH